MAKSADLEPSDLSATQARSLIDEIRRDADAMLPKVRRAFEGRAWRALGYESWDDLRRAEFPTLHVAIDDRPDAVRELREAGMSQRQIAGALGVSQKTVDRAMDQLDSDESNDSLERRTAMSGGREYTRSAPSRAAEPMTDEERPEVAAKLRARADELESLARRVEAPEVEAELELAKAIEGELQPADPWMRWRTAYLREIATAHGLLAHQTPAQVAERGDDECLSEFRRFVNLANDYLDRLDRALAEMYPENVTPLRRAK